MVCVSVLHRGQYGEVCVFASTLCKYDLRKGDLFFLSWARLLSMCVFAVNMVECMLCIRFCWCVYMLC